MGKLVVSLDGVVIKEVQITKDKTTLGRRPYNDIVIDNLAVSGEHAVLQMVGRTSSSKTSTAPTAPTSTARPSRSSCWQHNDTVEIGKYKIKYLVEDGVDYEKTMIMKPGAPPSAVHAVGSSDRRHVLAHTMPASNSRLRWVGQFPRQRCDQGAQRCAAGREVMLTKVVTTVGKPGVQVASITKRPGGYVLAHVEGSHAAQRSTGSQLAGDSAQLRNGDVIELAGTQMQFIHR
jgi:hypothetical protein